MASSAFITGLSSFAGRHLAGLLVESGWHVSGLVRSRRCGIDGVTEHNADICDEDALAAALNATQPDVVFHLAAIVDTVATPSVFELYRVNTLGTVAVSEAVRRSAPSARIVFTSSSFVYGHTTPEEQPVVETQPLRPLTPYGASKSAAEAVVDQQGRASGDVLVARAFQHTGHGHVGAYALSDWANQLALIERSGAPGVIATGNLDVERDYLDVRDVATAYLAIAERGTAGEIYNVCSGTPVTMRRMLDGLIEAFGVEVEVTVDPARLRSVDQPRFVGDNTALCDATGWRPHFELSDTLAALAAFWRHRVAEAPAA